MANPSESTIEDIENRLLDSDYSDMVHNLKKNPQTILNDLTPEDVDLWHMATGLMTECGELLSEWIGTTSWALMHRENTMKEFGDIEFFLEGAMNCFGESHSVENKFTKLFAENVPSVPSALFELFMSRMLIQATDFGTQVKARVVYRKDIDRDKALFALAGVRYYLDTLYKIIPVSRQEILRINMEKLKKRQPTGKYTDADAIARADEA